MKELLIMRLKDNLNKTATIFLINGFRFEGKIKTVDESFVEILDFKSNKIKLISLREIASIELKDSD